MSVEKLGKPELQDPGLQFESASQHKLPVLGSVTLQAETQQTDYGQQQSMGFNVTEIPDLNLLGRNAIKQLGISVDALLEQSSSANVQEVNTVFDKLVPDKQLQEACQQLCKEFPDLFKSELGKLKNFELEVKFKPNPKPVFCKPRSVPFSLNHQLINNWSATIS